MGSRLLGFLDDLVAAMAVDHTALPNPGHFDLSGPGRVVLGTVIKPPRMPYVTLSKWSADNGQGPPTRRWEWDVSLLVEGWAPVDARTADAGSRAAAMLAADLTHALLSRVQDTASPIYGVFRRYEVAVEGMNGEAVVQGPHHGFVRLGVSFAYLTTTTNLGL